MEVLAVGRDLQDLLVECRRLWVEPLGPQVIGDAVVEGHGTLRLLGPQVEVTERVGSGPVARLIVDDARVLPYRGVKAADPEELLRILECGFAINGQMDGEELLDGIKQG